MHLPSAPTVYFRGQLVQLAAVHARQLLPQVTVQDTHLLVAAVEGARAGGRSDSAKLQGGAGSCNGHACPAVCTMHGSSVLLRSKLSSQSKHSTCITISRPRQPAESAQHAQHLSNSAHTLTGVPVGALCASSALRGIACPAVHAIGCRAVGALAGGCGIRGRAVAVGMECAQCQHCVGVEQQQFDSWLGGRWAAISCTTGRCAAARPLANSQRSFSDRS